MITIVTGEVDSGKTTALLAIYQMLRGSAEGFAILKEYRDGQFIGQKVMDLLSGNTAPFSYLEDHFPSSLEKHTHYGRFILLDEGLSAADESIRKARLHRAQNIFADEFGPLELRGKGLWPTYRRLLNNLDLQKTNLYMAVRNTCVASCIHQLGLPCREVVII